MTQELGVLVAVCLPILILLPQQTQRHPAATQLLLDRLPIRQRACPLAQLARRKQLLVQCAVVERQQRFVAPAGGGDPAQIVLYRRPRPPRA